VNVNKQKKESKKMNRKILGVVLTIALILNGIALFAQVDKEIHKTYGAKKSVRIKTVSGECFIKAGSAGKIIVDLVYSAELEGAFEPEITESGTSLRLRERWYGSSQSGRITWTVTVPPETEIEFSTASGDLSVDGLTKSIEASTASGDIEVQNTKGEYDISTASGEVTIEGGQGEFDISTASGDIEAYQLQGEFDMSTASGDIEISDSQGMFDLSCASGGVETSNIIIEEESSFSTASGEVYVKLGKTSEYDLDISSASGRAILDYNGNPIKGTFEFTAKKRRGRIESPFSFDHEEEYERYDQIYMRKTFTKGGSAPKIIISTASGKAALRQ
jgi:DUF4097 and DUF4098 domain-containing protein YvlB